MDSEEKYKKLQQRCGVPKGFSVRNRCGRNGVYDMKLRPKTQMSESMLLAFFLTMAGGFQDAYSYNCRGEVFANAQTGNIVLLGQNLSQGNLGQVIHYLIPLSAFLLGVYLTERIQGKYKNYRQIHWRQIVLLAEIVMILIVGCMPQSVNISANALLSFACAMQVNSFRKFRGMACATTMCIGNMRSATAALCRYHQTKNPEMKKQSIHYFLIVFIFAVGAAVGALFCRILEEKAIWMAAGLLLIGFILMFVREENQEPLLR